MFVTAVLNEHIFEEQACFCSDNSTIDKKIIPSIIIMKYLLQKKGSVHSLILEKPLVARIVQSCFYVLLSTHLHGTIIKLLQNINYNVKAKVKTTRLMDYKKLLYVNQVVFNLYNELTTLN